MTNMGVGETTARAFALLAMERTAAAAGAQSVTLGVSTLSEGCGSFRLGH